MPWLPNLSGLGAKIVAGLAAAAAFLGALLLAIARLKQAGREAEQADQAKRNEQTRREADEVRNSVDAAGDAELDRLRDRWTR